MIRRTKTRTPWTDPRSLLASMAVHLLMFALISFVAFGVNMPLGRPTPPVLNAEIGPVDNRAPSEAAGGSPGEIGGTSETVRLSAQGTAERGSKPSDAADRLLADVISPTIPTSASEKAPPGPATTGLGPIEGTGAEAEAAPAGDRAAGVGKGIGPGTEFFGAEDRAASFVYVIDCSGSMSNRGALRLAKKELLSSLDRLPPDARFSVVFYTVRATVFPDANGQAALMPATVDNKERMRTRLTSLRPDGGTDHVRALQAAIALKPEVIFFLTDAERMEPSDAELVAKQLGPIRIQAVEFGDGPAIHSDSPLRDLATASGGTFRHIDLSTWKDDPAGNSGTNRP